MSRQTIKKWQTCDKPTDKSHRPDHLQTTLTSIQEEIVAILRQTLFLPLDDVVAKAPFHINKLLTDNGKEFTDRYIPNGERKPTGNHVFDQMCTKHGIEHRLTKVKQKVSGCFRTQIYAYAHAYCRISSYLQTMANKGYNPLVAIQMALAGKAL